MNWKRLVSAAAALVLGIVLLLGAGVWWVTSDLGRMIEWFGTPSAPFSEQTPPAAPDYASSPGWARHPGSDGDAQAAVFFVHPTTYLIGSRWNAPLDDERANEMIDDGVMPGQSRAFDACCDVYAPRYRQAIFRSFLVKDDSAKAALDLAYHDVLSAFEVFLDAIGDQPYVIAGHSQGALHATRLVEQRVSGSPEQDRLVAAYLVGYPVRPRVGAVPVCRSASQTGCAVGWSSMEPSAKAWVDMLVWEDGGWTTNKVANICVNPLTWEVGGVADASANLGGLLVEEGFSGLNVAPGLTDAACDGGRLLITPPNQGEWDILMGENHDDWHVYDYALFFSNIEANAQERVRAWHAAANAEE